MARGITKDDIVQDFAVLHGINQETARLYFDSFATLIAEGLNTNTLADVVRQEPTSKKENWAYYQCAVNADGVAVDVDFRMIRTKDI